MTTEFQKAWAVLEAFVDTELTRRVPAPEFREDTETVLRALGVVRKANVHLIAAFHVAGIMQDDGQHCTNCNLKMLKAGETPYPTGELILIDGTMGMTRDSMGPADQRYYKGAKYCL